jgi:hypothetical protein
MVQLFPEVRQPGGVAAACLLEVAEWVRHWERLHARCAMRIVGLKLNMRRMAS